MFPPVELAEVIDYVLLELDDIKPLIPTYTHLLISTLFALYIGSHASLSRPSSARKPSKEERAASESDDEDDSEDDESTSVMQKMEGLEPSDAIMFPIMSGLTLGGLYLLIKNFDITYINKILNWYFTQAGTVFACSFVSDGLSLVRSLVFPSRYSSRGALWRVNQERRVFDTVATSGSTPHSLQARKSPLPGFLGRVCLPKPVLSCLWRLRGISYQKATLRLHVRSIMDLKFSITILDVIALLFAVAVEACAILWAKPWWLTNFFGFCFTYGALQIMSPTTFWTGSLILGSLFFYDIYFVFYTPLMVTVATKLDIPIKLLFPRPPAPSDDPDIVSLAMLGLGDIVVPGTMIGLALRFDLFLHYLRTQKPTSDSKEDGRSRYISATGGWGERIWTRGLRSLGLPDEEKSYFISRSFRKTYFKAGIGGYVLGIVATLLSMQLSKHPQPALLFLVPGVLISIWLTAFVKGDISTMWQFSDAVSDDEAEAEEETKKKDNAAESDAAPKGLFSRLFGSSSTSTSKESESNKDEGKEKASEKGDRSDKHSSDNELFSFSIRLPDKPERKDKVTDDDDNDDARTDESFSFESSQSSDDSEPPSPVLVQREGEPPLKKRRGIKR